jgi:hypothetical protein
VHAAAVVAEDAHEVLAHRTIAVVTGVHVRSERRRQR